MHTEIAPARRSSSISGDEACAHGEERSQLLNGSSCAKSTSNTVAARSTASPLIGADMRLARSSRGIGLAQRLAAPPEASSGVDIDCDACEETSWPMLRVLMGSRKACPPLRKTPSAASLCECTLCSVLTQMHTNTSSTLAPFGTSPGAPSGSDTSRRRRCNQPSLSPTLAVLGGGASTDSSTTLPLAELSTCGVADRSVAAAFHACGSSPGGEAAGEAHAEGTIVSRV
mmetsp:Transcript_35727/g.83373  ORF Transcript_35727/g.83373 Transcript_35727/m.83373 type:complete len:229 (-) Transcript_35727:401-1087(-)